MAIIGVDVDYTIVNMDQKMIEHCRKDPAGVFVEPVAGVDRKYDYSDIFPFIDHSVTMECWGKEDLYDDVNLLPGVVDVLDTLRVYGHSIVFVSHITGNHHDSKVRMLKRHVPFDFGFVATEQKQYARVDLLLDDRFKNLNNALLAGITPVFFDAGFEQCVPALENYATFDKWDSNMLSTLLTLAEVTHELNRY
jgi:5'(3')-deoxyribonucleotidase